MGNHNTVLLQGKELTPLTWYIGLASVSALNPTTYTLTMEAVDVPTLAWDPGTNSLGSQIVTNASLAAGDYYFRVILQPNSPTPARCGSHPVRYMATDGYWLEMDRSN